jgi:predicted transcriptional regulator
MRIGGGSPPKFQQSSNNYTPRGEWTVSERASQALALPTAQIRYSLFVISNQSLPRKVTKPEIYFAEWRQKVERVAHEVSFFRCRSQNVI